MDYNNRLINSYPNLTLKTVKYFITGIYKL